MPFIKRLVPFVLSIIVLTLVIFRVEPPETWKEASIPQILAIFVPLLILYTNLINLSLDNLPKSFMLSLGLFFISLFQSTRTLNFLTIIVVLIYLVLIIKYYPKKRLTFEGKLKPIKLNEKKGFHLPFLSLKSTLPKRRLKND